MILNGRQITQKMALIRNQMIPSMTDTTGQAHIISAMIPAIRAIVAIQAKTSPAVTCESDELEEEGGVYDGSGGVCTTVRRLGGVGVVLIGGFSFRALVLTVDIEEDADLEVGLRWGLAFFLGGANEYPHLGHSFKPSSL